MNIIYIHVSISQNLREIDSFFLRVFWPRSFSRKMFLPIHVAVKFDNAVIFALQVWFIKRIKPRLKVQILKFGEQENR